MSEIGIDDFEDCGVYQLLASGPSKSRETKKLIFVYNHLENMGNYQVEVRTNTVIKSKDSYTYLKEAIKAYNNA